MLRIAAAQIGPHVLITSAPESRQVARNLYGTVRGRQQFDEQRDTPAGNGRMHGKPEQLLDPDSEPGPLLCFAFGGPMRAARAREVPGWLAFGALAQIPRHK